MCKLAYSGIFGNPHFKNLWHSLSFAYTQAVAAANLKQHFILH